eukprot:gene3313-8257_t
MHGSSLTILGNPTSRWFPNSWSLKRISFTKVNRSSIGAISVILMIVFVCVDCQLHNCIKKDYRNCGNGVEIYSTLSGSSEECVSSCLKRSSCRWAVFIIESNGGGGSGGGGGSVIATSIPYRRRSFANNCWLYSSCNKEFNRGSSLYYCQRCRLCPSGEENVSCSENSEGDCQQCKKGKYKSSPSLSPCLVCQSCQRPNQYRIGCGGSNEGSCVSCGGCSSGQYRTNCGGLSSGSCTSCPTCSSGQYRIGCTGISAGGCVNCGTCPAGRERVGCG